MRYGGCPDDLRQMPHVPPKPWSPPALTRRAALLEPAWNCIGPSTPRVCGTNAPGSRPWRDSTEPTAASSCQGT